MFVFVVGNKMHFTFKTINTGGYDMYKINCIG